MDGEEIWCVERWMGKDIARWVFRMHEGLETKWNFNFQMERNRYSCVENYYAIMSEDELVPYDEPALSDDEIYDMLKPKMKNSNVWNHGYRVAA